MTLLKGNSLRFLRFGTNNTEFSMLDAKGGPPIRSGSLPLNVSANQTCTCRVYAVGSAGPASTPRSARTSRLPLHLLKSCPELFDREPQRQFCIWFGRCHTYHLRHLRGARHTGRPHGVERSARHRDCSRGTRRLGGLVPVQPLDQKALMGGGVHTEL